jgi:type II secretory pathway pseudopilin PulG
MCDPLTLVAVASAGLQYQTAKAQQKAQYEAQKRQNEIARQNAIRRYATEQLKIRQEIKKSKVKGFEASIRSKKARARFIAGSEGLAMSGSQEALFRDYYRVQGNYNSALQENLQLNINQFERNLEAIQFGQKSQSTYVQPPNPNLLFVSGALNVANTYYGVQAMKDARGLNPDPSQPNLGGGSTRTNIYGQTVYPDGSIGL